MKLDATDRALLAELQADARLNVKTTAAKLGLTKTPVYERLKRYDQEGIIEKQVAVLDRTQVPTGMVVFCSVLLESQRIEEIEAFKEAIAQIPEVMECYLMGGANDFLLKVVVEDLESYHHFSSGKLARLANVRQIQSTFVLQEVKRSTVFPIYDK
ncbi:MAG TPA: AsnC family transcriptional regulator [Cytophagales bacterium]|nr:AsnC family transcriptional regulator [Cytophagales bacterium]HAA20151.1 AsnC family transcriptional regulator [Cytophagales bacterium]HAP65089.1 AsnC family transcriptional regulator [Cytophagales bacterium]